MSLIPFSDDRKYKIGDKAEWIGYPEDSPVEIIAFHPDGYVGRYTSSRDHKVHEQPFNDVQLRSLTSEKAEKEVEN